MTVTLTILDGRRRTVLLDRPRLLVGRAADCDLRLESALVSRHHCELTLEDGRVYVRDLHSSNGTALNNQMLVGERPLHDGDRLWVAATPIHVHIRSDRSAVARMAEVFQTLRRRAFSPTGISRGHRREG